MPNPVHSIGPASAPGARGRWLELSKSCSHLGAFDDIDFVVGLAKSQGLGCDVVFSSSGGQDLFASLLVHRRIGPFREVILPRFCPTTAMLVPDQVGTPDVEVFRQALDRVADLYHRAGLHVPSSRSHLIYSERWENTPLFTYHLYPSDLPEDVTTEWSASTRRLFRRNVDRYQVREDSSDASAAVQLCAESYKRSGRPLPLQLPEIARFAASPSGDVSSRVFIAEGVDSKEAEAALITLHYRETAYYWIAGGRPGAGMTVLIGYVLRILRDDGIKVFDFLGANTPSIAEFKRRFGSTLHEYSRISTSRSGILDVLISMRRRLG